MNKEAILKEENSKLIANPDKMYAQNPSIITAAYNAMDQYAKQQAIAFGRFRDKFKLLEMARIDKIIQEKGMITYDRAKDEYIYDQLLEHQKQNNQ